MEFRLTDYVLKLGSKTPVLFLSNEISALNIFEVLCLIGIIITSFDILFLWATVRDRDLSIFSLQEKYTLFHKCNFMDKKAKKSFVYRCFCLGVFIHNNSLRIKLCARFLFLFIIFCQLELSTEYRPKWIFEYLVIILQNIFSYLGFSETHTKYLWGLVKLKNK